MRFARVVVALVLAGLVSGGWASAAFGAWSEVTLVPQQPFERARVALGTAGIGVATWEGLEGITGAVVDPAGGGVGPPWLLDRRAPPAPGWRSVLLYGRDRLIALQVDEGAPTGRPALSVSFGRPGSALTPPRRIAFVASDGEPYAGGNARGDVAVLATAPISPRRRATRLVLHVRRAGRSDWRPRSLPASRNAKPFGLAVNQRGDVLTVEHFAGRLHARLLTAGGVLGPIRELGPGGHYIGSMVLTDRRDAAVAWLRRTTDRCVAREASVAVARRGGRFRRTVLTAAPGAECGRRVPAPGALVAGDRAGAITVAWTTVVAGRYVVRAADIRRQRVGAPRTVSAPEADAHLRSLIAGPTGERIVVWTPPVPAPTPTPPYPSAPPFFAAVRGNAAATWSPPESVGIAGYPGSGAIDARSGRVVLLVVSEAGMRVAFRDPIVPLAPGGALSRTARLARTTARPTTLP